MTLSAMDDTDLYYCPACKEDKPGPFIDHDRTGKMVPLTHRHCCLECWEEYSARMQRLNAKQQSQLLKKGPDAVEASIAREARARSERKEAERLFKVRVRTLYEAEMLKRDCLPKAGLHELLGLKDIKIWYRRLQRKLRHKWQRTPGLRCTMQFTVPLEKWDLKNELQTRLAYHYSNIRVHEYWEQDHSTQSPIVYADRTYAALIQARLDQVQLFNPRQGADDKWWTDRNTMFLVNSTERPEEILIAREEHLAAMEESAAQASSSS